MERRVPFSWVSDAPGNKAVREFTEKLALELGNGHNPSIVFIRLVALYCCAEQD
jgi:hypothetical protein